MPIALNRQRYRPSANMNLPYQDCVNSVELRGSLPWFTPDSCVRPFRGLNRLSFAAKLLALTTIQTLHTYIGCLLLPMYK